MDTDSVVKLITNHEMSKPIDASVKYAVTFLQKHLSPCPISLNRKHVIKYSVFKFGAISLTRYLPA
jgi:hypothetical protein